MLEILVILKALEKALQISLVGVSVTGSCSHSDRFWKKSG
jgi:hypothetical protein